MEMLVNEALGAQGKHHVGATLPPALTKARQEYANHGQLNESLAQLDKDLVGSNNVVHYLQHLERVEVQTKRFAQLQKQRKLEQEVQQEER